MREIDTERVREAFADIDRRVREHRDAAEREALEFAKTRGYGEAEARALADYIRENAPTGLSPEEERLYAALLPFSTETAAPAADEPVSPEE